MNLSKIVPENKKGMGGVAVTVIIIAVLVVGILGYVALAPPSTQSAVDSTKVTETGEQLCADATVTPSLTINAYDKDNVGTSLTEATNVWRYKGDKSWTAFTAGTAFDVSGGRTIEVIMGISATNFVDNAYGQMFEYVVPCTENPSIERSMVNDEVEDSVTATYYNADGDASAIETFSADESQTVSIIVKAGADEYFGNPYLQEKEGYQNLLILHLNTTTWDKPDQVYLADGTELKSVSVPQRFSVEQTLTGRTAYAYAMPIIVDKNMEIFLDLNSDDENAPVYNDTAYFHASGYYVNAETGDVEFGIETEENADVASSDPASVSLRFS